MHLASRRDRRREIAADDSIANGSCAAAQTSARDSFVGSHSTRPDRTPPAAFASVARLAGPRGRSARRSIQRPIRVRRECPSTERRRGCSVPSRAGTREQLSSDVSSVTSLLRRHGERHNQTLCARRVPTPFADCAPRTEASPPRRYHPSSAHRRLACDESVREQTMSAPNARSDSRRDRQLRNATCSITSAAWALRRDGCSRVGRADGHAARIRRSMRRETRDR